MLKQDDSEGNKRSIGDDAIPSTDGVLIFLGEIYRISHTPGLTQWCTPGHNRGQALETGMSSLDEAMPVPATPMVSMKRI